MHVLNIFFHLSNSNCYNPFVAQWAMIIPVICSDQRKSNGWTGMTLGNQTASDGQGSRQNQLGFTLSLKGFQGRGKGERFQLGLGIKRPKEWHNGDIGNHLKSIKICWFQVQLQHNESRMATSVARCSISAAAWIAKSKLSSVQHQAFDMAMKVF